MGKPEYTERRGQNLSIWPFILIGIGVVWLLAEAKILSAANLSVLWRLWPVVLIAIGLELLIGRGSRLLSTLIGAVTVVLLVVLMMVGPSLGLARGAEVKTQQANAALQGATSANVELAVNTGNLIVDSLDDDANLMKADVSYMGTLDYDVSGGAERTITLKNEAENGPFGGLNVFDALFQSRSLDWDVALNPSVPLNLQASNGTGSTHLNLESFQLTGLNVNSGTGSVEVNLPAPDASYDAHVSTGTGSLTIAIPDGAALDLTVSTGTGSVNLDVPDDAAVTITASTGTGSVNVPGFLRRITQPSQGLGQNGTWQSDNFDGAERQIVISYNGGTGSLNVR